MDKKSGINLTYLVIAILAIMTFQAFWSELHGVERIPYSEFQELLDAGKVQEVLATSNELYGELKPDESGQVRRFVTTRVESDLAKELKAHGVTFSKKTESPWMPILVSWVLPIVVMVFIWAVFIRRLAERGGGAGFMSIGKSKARIYVENDTKVTFQDVAGVEEGKEELREVVAFLKDPKRYGRLGARMPKGVLLVGPPGTGKTLLARAVAGEAGVPFFSISGSEFVEMFVGVGAARVRDLFEQARSKAPCIIFVDELDALGRARSAAAGLGGHDEKEQTLNQLLVELDGFDPTSGIVLLGATNRPEVLDPALLRAGRFDRQILVDRPDKQGRLAILKVHVKNIAIDDSVSLDQVAALTAGFTGADLANLVNEAALVATRRDAPKVEMRDFNVAIERIIAGLERKNRLLSEREREIVSYHELGHTLVAAALPGADPVHKVSIIPRGIGALGYTIQRPTEDRYLMTQEELENKMTVLLGGRAAEYLVFDHFSTGAADDLSKATEIARSMVTRYGMFPGLGHATYETEPSTFLGVAGPPQRNYSEETAREIDCAIRGVVQKAFERARNVLTTNRPLLEEGARALLEKETLEQDDLAALLSRVSPEPEEARTPPTGGCTT